METTWTVDPIHSDVQFKIKHLVISTVTGALISLKEQLQQLMALKM